MRFLYPRRQTDGFRNILFLRRGDTGFLRCLLVYLRALRPQGVHSEGDNRRRGAFGERQRALRELAFRKNEEEGHGFRAAERRKEKAL